MMDDTNKVAEDFFIKQLPYNHLEKTNRVSFTQFLSLFNVTGTAGHAKLDALYQMFEEKIRK